MTQNGPESQSNNKMNGSPLKQASIGPLLLALNALKQHSISTIHNLQSALESLTSNEMRVDLLHLTLTAVQQKEDQPSLPTIFPTQTDNTKNVNLNRKQLGNSDTKIDMVEEQRNHSPESILPSTHGKTPVNKSRGNTRQARDAAASVKRSLSVDQNPFLGQKTLPNPFPKSTTKYNNDDDLKDPFPLENGSDNWCRVCNEKCKSDTAYKNHLTKKHNMCYFAAYKCQPEGVKFYCKWCDECYEEPNEYRQHLIMVHKVIKITTNATDCTIVNPNKTPYMYNPYFYCYSCEVTFYKISVYKKHLLKIHILRYVTRRTMPTRHLKALHWKPSMDPLNHYCEVCEKEFAKPLFRRHLRTQHDVVHPALYALAYQHGAVYSLNDERDDED